MTTDAARMLDSLARQIRENFEEAIETRLSVLVSSGIAIDRIRLLAWPGKKTQIVVDNIPVAEFTIGYEIKPVKEGE